MQRFTLEFSTEGNNQIINVSPELARKMAEVRGSGVVHLFLVGSTAALTTLEFEPGLVRHDMKAVFERLAPEDEKYEHEQTWNDDNGHSHVRAALLGPSVTIPFANGKLLTGEYQQVVLIDFDTSPRRRTIIATVLI
jgi:secondary thiamine-phosphate synthase enzyme